MLSLVVARNGNVDQTKRGISVAKGNCWDVDVGRFSDGLVVGSRVSENQQTRFHKLVLDLVGKSTGRISASNSLSSGIFGELEDSTLTKVPGGDNANILGVFNGDDDSSGQNQLLPSLLEINQIDTITASLPYISGHSRLQISGTKVDLASEHLLDVIFSRIEDCR